MAEIDCQNHMLKFKLYTKETIVPEWKEYVFSDRAYGLLKVIL